MHFVLGRLGAVFYEYRDIILGGGVIAPLIHGECGTNSIRLKACTQKS